MQKLVKIFTPGENFWLYSIFKHPWVLAQDTIVFDSGISTFIAHADFGEERTEISVKSSFQLDLPPHLIFPSSSIKLNETIGQGINFVYTASSI